MPVYILGLHSEIAARAYEKHAERTGRKRQREGGLQNSLHVGKDSHGISGFAFCSGIGGLGNMNAMHRMKCDSELSDIAHHIVCILHSSEARHLSSAWLFLFTERSALKMKFTKLGLVAGMTMLAGYSGYALTAPFGGKPNPWVRGFNMGSFSPGP